MKIALRVFGERDWDLCSNYYRFEHPSLFLAEIDKDLIARMLKIASTMDDSGLTRVEMESDIGEYYNVEGASQDLFDDVNIDLMNEHLDSEDTCLRIRSMDDVVRSYPKDDKENIVNRRLYIKKYNNGKSFGFMCDYHGTSKDDSPLLFLETLWIPIEDSPTTVCAFE